MQQRQQLALGLDVERLELGEALEQLAGGVELARAHADAGQRAQHAARQRPQPGALGQRPLRVGLVGQEVAAVERRRPAPGRPRRA